MTPALSEPPITGLGASPVALLSAANLRANAALAVGRQKTSDALAADAWGHGAEWVASTLRADGHRLDRLDATTLYGVLGAPPEARPVLSLHGRVLGVKELLRGEGVSYGYTHRAPHDTRIALVTGGYAQGVVRALGNAATVSIDGLRHRIVGRVAMDVCVIDIGDASVERGGTVTFFGDARLGHPSLEEWTDATGWRADEIVALVGSRARRRVVA